MGRYHIYAVAILCFFLMAPMASAWWNETSYGFRYNVSDNSSLSLPIFINGSNNQPYYWAMTPPTGDNIYLYCAVLGCRSGEVAIANDTTQKWWENDTSMLGYLPTSIWSSYPAQGVWHMNNDAGTVYDSSGNSRDCTVAGAPTTVDGVFSNALSFDGTNDYLDCGADFKNLVTSYTLEAWVKVDNVADTCWVFADAVLSGIAGGRQVFASGGDQWYYFTYNGAVQEAGKAGEGIASADTWYHVTAMTNGTGMYLYVNSSFIGKDISSGTTGVTDVNLRIGGRERDNLKGNCTIEEARFWGKSLNETEIWTLWQARANVSGSVNIPPTTTTTTTTVPHVKGIDVLQCFYCDMLWSEQNADVKTNHNWCTDNQTLARNVTFNIIVDGNQSEIVTYSEEICRFGCENRTNTCNPPEVEQYGIWLLWIVVIIIGIGVINWLWRRS